MDLAASLYLLHADYTTVVGSADILSEGEELKLPDYNAITERVHANQ